MMLAIAVSSLLGLFGAASLRLQLQELRERRRARELKAWNMRALPRGDT